MLTRIASVLLPSLLFATAACAHLPGYQLADGMQLTYAAPSHQLQGKRSDPWVIESVRTGVDFAGRKGTTVIQLRTEGPRSAVETRRFARESGMLHEYDEKERAWKAARPLRPGLTLEFKGADGAVKTRFEAHTLAVETISGVSTVVVHTSVLTLEGGKVVRRLRERFSTGLATATGGVFEKVDPQAPGGFAPQFAFELVNVAPR